MTERPDDAVPGASDQVPEDDATSGGDERGDGVPAWLREPADLSFESPGQPERELRDLGPRRSRRAHRSGTNPAADDAPDVAPARDAENPAESDHDRWLRAQRPPHWE